MGELLRFVLGIESRLEPVSRTAVAALAPWREGSPASLGYDARTMRAPSPSKTVGLLAYDDMQVLDLAGPLDVFGGANAFARGAPPYALCVFGLQAQAVRAENGLSIVPALALENVPPLDTLLIPGGMGARLALPGNARLLDWLRERAGGTRRIVSVCTGAYVLAAAGLLDGRRVTTHWRYADDLAHRYPALQVETDRLFLRDGRFATCGGLTAGMDLALVLVEEDLGTPVALGVARQLVMYMKRAGNQAQFSTPLAAQARGSGRLGALVEWLMAHLDGDRMALPAERVTPPADPTAPRYRSLVRHSARRGHVTCLQMRRPPIFETPSTARRRRDGTPAAPRRERRRRRAWETRRAIPTDACGAARRSS